MKPFRHQAEVLERCKDERSFAVLWEQGTGKTKLALDNAAYLHAQRKIDAVLVLAPNGVHRNWIDDEIPAHMNGDVYAVAWETGRSASKAHQAMMYQAEIHPFPIVAMSYDAFMTNRGKAWAAKYFRKRTVFYVLDESTAIKTPRAKRTMSVVSSGNYAPYRRILTGTPIVNSPFDIYAPIKFLDPNFWKQNGFGTFTEFKNYFGIWKEGINYTQHRVFKYVVGYKNLAQLNEILGSISSRVTKEQTLDLPPKLYSKRYFDLSAEQQRVYKEIKEQALTLLNSGQLLTAPLAITRLLRLQQVTSNYLPADDEIVDIDKEHNPRLACLAQLLEEVTTQTIIWARFRRDVDQIVALLGDRAVRYDGAVDNDDRAKAKAMFQAGEKQFFVGNPAAGGMGLTLTAARTVIYYNNSFRLADRLQSEDRAHRIGQEHPVEYVDIIASGTVDMYIVKALRNKIDIASTITGDQLKEWI